MPKAVVAAAFQHVGETDEIGVDISMRIDERVAHAGLRREMHHVLEAMLCEQRCHAVALCEIEPDKRKARQLFELSQAGMLQRRIVVRIDIIDSDRRPTLFQQTARDMIADEPSRAGDENGTYRRHRSTPSGLLARSSRDLTSSTMPLPSRNKRCISGQPSRR